MVVHKDLMWVQIPATDIKRAANFYQVVFGYESFFEILNGRPHYVFTKNSHGEKPINGSIIKVDSLPEKSTGCVLFFDATGRFDEIELDIEKSGGKVLHSKTLIRQEVGNGLAVIPQTYIDDGPGYYAHFIDSEGNMMGLYGVH